MLDALAAAQPPGPAPAPSHSTAPSVDVGTIIHSVWHGLWSGVTASPWTLLATAAFLVLVSVRMIHAVAHPTTGRDPIRLFDRADKAELLRRAGGRCEHHGWIGGRCKATEYLEADHVHPWSRGGWTHVSNGQILCKRHNREKRATIPFNWQLRGLAKGRAAYYPPGQPGTVTRHRPAARRSRVEQKQQPPDFRRGAQTVAAENHNALEGRCPVTTRRQATTPACSGFVAAVDHA